MLDYKGDRTTGFASPAADHVDGTVDLSAVLDLQRPSRFPVRVTGDALHSRGIRHSDVLVVDTSLAPTTGAIVVASVGDEMRVCEIVRDKRGWWLRPSSPHDEAIAIEDGSDVAIWAVVTALVRTEV